MSESPDSAIGQDDHHAMYRVWGMKALIDPLRAMRRGRQGGGDATRSDAGVGRPGKKLDTNTAPADTRPDLVIVCGYGTMPFELARCAAETGRRPFLVGIEGEVDSQIEQYPHHLMAWGQMGGFFRILKENNIREMAFAGGISRRPNLLRTKLDLKALLTLPEAFAVIVGGDNRVLTGAIRLLERRGVQVVGVHQIAPQLLARAGAISGRKPGKRDLHTMRLAFDACKALGRFDIGQAVVAEAERIVAVEGVEGTDMLLQRVVQMRRIGRMPALGRNGVLVKALKPGQDIRADLPAIGPQTVTRVAEAGLRGIAVEADNSVILEREATLAAARRAGIYIYGMSAAGDRHG